MNSLKWIIDLHLRQPYKLIYVLIVSIIEIFLFLVPISLTADIFEQVFQQDFSNILKALLVLLLFAIFQAIVYFSINFINEVMSHRVTTDMTQQLFESLQHKSLTYHDGKDIGQIMARATGDTRTINKALSPGIVRSIQLITIWAISFYISWLVHWVLLIYTFVIFWIYLFSLYQFARTRIVLSNEVLVQFANLSEYSLQTISGINEIKNYAASNFTQNKFDMWNDKHNRALRIEGEKSAWFYPALIVTFYAAGMISLSVYYAFQQIIGFREVVLVAGVILFLRSFSSQLQWQVRMIIAAIAATRRVYDLIFEEDIAKNDTPELFDFRDHTATIEFKSVSFKYRQDLPYVLNKVSVSIKDNQTVAIVGGPGSGKSTLTKLIQRLYLPSQGRILISGKPIENFKNAELRKFIATVEQDIFLFNISIFDNIKFGNPDATKEEVEKVAKIAHAHDFISQFPQKYETIVGEGGIKLSGGQAQRLSIARALLVNPSILLMDDGASALDARTELEIQGAISDILKTRTTIITTHRLAIIAKADIVLILNKGELVGKGTHSELIRNNYYYRRLFEHHYILPPFEENHND